MKKIIITGALLSILNYSLGQSYAPPAGQQGTTAMHKDSSAFIAWATGIQVERGYVQIGDKNVEYNETNKASFGEPELALGKPNGTTTKAVSLGDGGMATLTFDKLITNGDGWDFAVFENSVTDDFLEFAFVEVSSDGINFFRFPSHSEVQFTTQTDGFGATDCRYINNLAGKYKLNYGTPFDLDDISDTLLLDKNAIRYVRVIDVVGSINPQFASYDSHGNIINDPYPTPFHSSGFDLTGVGVINGIEDPFLSVKNNNLKFEIYPTIVDERCFIHSEVEFDYRIIDLTGKEWGSGKGKSGENIILMDTLPQGVFLVQIESLYGNSIFRVVKI